MPCFSSRNGRFFGRCPGDKAAGLVYHHYKISYQKALKETALSHGGPTESVRPRLEADAGLEKLAYRLPSRAGEMR